MRCARHGGGIGDESPLGTRNGGIPHRSGKGVFEKGVSVGAIWKAGELSRVPHVVDRVVQQAVLQVMSPHYEPEFHRCSHGFLKGRSCQTAIKETVSHIEEGYDWVVDIDLEKFLDRVHHQRLVSKLEKKITDKRVTRLIVKLLKSKVVMPDGVVITNEEGAPQGGPLTPSTQWKTFHGAVGFYDRRFC
ncbi:MAG: hypothetical protein JXR76_16225 [Deltaproteobacteria bacterium]|nr:hypothetical protein [Deltaproteobacteria bacterium]